jgi:hypothetical protein
LRGGNRGRFILAAPDAMGEVRVLAFVLAVASLTR